MLFELLFEFWFELSLLFELLLLLLLLPRLLLFYIAQRKNEHRQGAGAEGKAAALTGVILTFTSILSSLLFPFPLFELSLFFDWELSLLFDWVELDWFWLWFWFWPFACAY